MVLLAPLSFEVISFPSLDNDVAKKNMQEQLLNYMNTTSGLFPIIVLYTYAHNVIRQFLVAFMSSFTVIELLFYLTWTKSADCSFSW